MQWGVRRERRNRRLREGGAKDAGKAAKILALNRLLLTPTDMLKGRGISGGAIKKATRISNRVKRIKDGKAHVGSKIIHYGSTHIDDLIPVRTKNIDKRNLLDRPNFRLSAYGANFVYNLLPLL
jgi:hypothetical protein